MNPVLARWNAADPSDAAAQILPCCGSRAWSEEMTRLRPLTDEISLLAASDRAWRSLDPADWLQAFRSHPRIGESPDENQAGSHWSLQEQRSIAVAEDRLKTALTEANRVYEQKFGHIFIVCATGKSASEILEILSRRMHNDAQTELWEAAEQQRQITQLRLRKWLTT